MGPEPGIVPRRSTSDVFPRIDTLVKSGLIGGRTVQINDRGEVGCHSYPLAPLSHGVVRVRTARSVISPGTEMTFYGKAATNVHLHKTWDPNLRLFVPGSPSVEPPIVFGYRAAGAVVDSRVVDVPVGTRLFGNWFHTEFTVLDAETARGQRLPDGLSYEDGVDLGRMGPVCLNAVAYAEGKHVAAPAVVFGAGPVGLMTAQIVRAGGASDVYVVDRLPGRLEIADGLGLQTLNASAVDDVAVELKSRVGSDSIAVAFECSGSTLALNEAIRLVRRRGAVVAAGFYQGEGNGLFLGEEFHHNAVKIVSAQIGNIHPDWTLGTLRARVVELVLAGQLVLGELPRVTVPVEKVAAGFEALTRPNDVLQVALSYD